MTLHPLTGTHALLFALGLGLVLAGAHLLLHSSQLRRRGRRTWGSVSGTDTNPARTHVTFRTTDGELVTV
ncbi:hypothetical protein LJ737_21835 [Hymenobacter sp. 15J16-1T3B]|uniref:hypothetical protein n=1 Tax=Hymenobacter sp. 15J16-1T3B TaxID=2886941 RepID=UPI001D0FB09E|nr:hypothetical protein [Hymenobacter sp. 15J16-1T3B]MCC3159897.1 hypothetical protein [Hymenobacter sp. 15J16-1T3B]